MTQIFTPVSEARVDLFADKLHGELARPGDPNYGAVRQVWNGMIDKYPAMIARCVDADDVMTAVNFARENDILLSIRAGGHNVAGSATNDGGLVIDLRPMKGIIVNAEKRAVRAEAGVLIGELDAATQEFGLATPMGVVTETGIAGLTLGGGFGWLRSKYGMSIDALRSVKVVTADGRLITASADENADLFWGIRGGGGNFGIVVEFEYELFPVGPDVFFNATFYPLSQGKKVLEAYREYIATAPDEISSMAVLGFIPEADSFPQEIHHEPFVLLLAVHADDVEAGRQATQPLRNIVEPLLDLSDAMPFIEVQQFFDEDYPAGDLRYYWKSSFVNSLTDEVIDCVIDNANKIVPTSHSTIDVWHLGGKMSRVNADATAYRYRNAGILLGVEGNWEHAADDDANIGWARTMMAEVEQLTDAGMYMNFPGWLEENTDGEMQKAFGANYRLLVDLKGKYDPTNLFRMNQNIRPANT
jgi:FAD/FMN-containing dehydrogenase